jgi:phosphoglycerol transferase MdoB-like AlkP superfamily enzyme
MFFLTAGYNPFVTIFNNLMSDVRAWTLAVMVGVDIVTIIITAIKYKQAPADERPKHIRYARNLILMVLGVYVLIWLVVEVNTRFSGVV